ncbi:hypothetical protein HDK90DRAFT_462097 [Phyllosticta capitalensis]|uniref:Uncharacterized protein n=1 Tax=Phyllosticta capitalensis TaxID=121624 RepID=A0ABR1Z4M4_9PEZI
MAILWAEERSEDIAEDSDNDSAESEAGDLPPGDGSRSRGQPAITNFFRTTGPSSAHEDTHSTGETGPESVLIDGTELEEHSPSLFLEYLEMPPRGGRDFVVTQVRRHLKQYWHKEAFGCSIDLDTWKIIVNNISNQSPPGEKRELKWPTPITETEYAITRHEFDMLRLAIDFAVPQPRLFILPEVSWHDRAAGELWLYECSPPHTIQWTHSARLDLQTRNGVIGFEIRIVARDLDLHAPVPKLDTHVRFQDLEATIEELIYLELTLEQYYRHRRAIDICHYAAAVMHDKFFDSLPAIHAFLEQLTLPFKRHKRREWPFLLGVQRDSEKDVSAIKFNSKIVSGLTRIQTTTGWYPPFSYCQAEPPVVLLIISSTPEWVCTVVDTIWNTFREARSMPEIMEAGRRATQVVNQRIREGKHPWKTCCCSEAQAGYTLHSCSMCFIQTLCTALSVDNSTGHRTCYSCRHPEHKNNTSAFSDSGDSDDSDDSQ